MGSPIYTVTLTAVASGGEVSMTERMTSNG